MCSMQLEFPEAVVQRCSVKKAFLEIPQNSQKNTCATVSFLIKLHALGKIAKFLRTPLVTSEFPSSPYSKIKFVKAFFLCCLLY